MTVEFLSELAHGAYDFDFYGTMRRLEANFRAQPRFGQALRPSDEGVRLGQDPDLAFAPSQLTSFTSPTDEQPGRLRVAFLGLFGAQGPLPLHITEYVRERLRHFGDRTFSAFVDLFHHRLMLLFYRAWAQAQPTAWQDRAEDNRFDSYVGALIGLGMPSLLRRDALPDSAKFQYAGYLCGGVRGAAGLAAVLSDYFELPVAIDEFQGEWLELPTECRTRLGGDAEDCVLGRGTVLGKRVYRSDSKFRVRLGPLSNRDYLRFLPGKPSLTRLSSFIRLCVGDALSWDICLQLSPEENAQIRLGQAHRLGWNATLGPNTAGDVVIDPNTNTTIRTRRPPCPKSVEPHCLES